MNAPRAQIEEVAKGNAQTTGLGGSQGRCASAPLTNSAVAINGVVTLSIFVFPFLDQGILTSTMLAGAVSYWFGAAVIGIRRAGTLTRGDRLYLMLGQIACVGAFLIGLWSLDL